MILAMWMTGCGGATGALIGALSQDSSGRSSTNVTVSQLELVDQRKSPALLQLALRHPFSLPTGAQLTLELADGTLAPLRLVDDRSQGIHNQLQELSSSPEGLVNLKLWDFAAQVGESFRGVSLIVELDGETSQHDVVVGNDPPSIEREPGGDFAQVSFPELAPGASAQGIVHIQFVVTDSSSDRVTVSVEYAVVDGPDLTGGERPPDSDFHPATLAGSTLSNISVSPTGRTLDLFWSTLQDVGTAEAEITLRLTPNDNDPLSGEGDIGEPTLVHSLRVDNNDPPTIDIANGLFLLSTDQRGGIPIPFTVSDPNGDRLDIIFQWREEGSVFPALPEGADEIRQLLRDPIQRLFYQIATEIPVIHGGNLGVPGLGADPDGLRAYLPEIHNTASSLLGSAGIVGRRLEILRDSIVPRPSTAVDDGVKGLVKAVPLDNGTAVALLDSPNQSDWRVQALDLATGMIQSVIATGSGRPTAMARGFVTQTLIVATVEGNSPGETWAFHQVDLADASAKCLVRSDQLPSTLSGFARDLVPISATSILATIGSSIVRVDVFSSGQISVYSILGGAEGPLVEPTGIAADMRNATGTYFLADRGLDRILSVDLQTGIPKVIFVRGGIVPAPMSVALSANHQELFVLTDDPSMTGLELQFLRLGHHDRDQDGVSDGELNLVVSGIDGSTGCLALGPDNLRVITTDDPCTPIWVGGGVEQAREITGYEPQTGAVLVDTPFAPLLKPADAWRVRDTSSGIPTNPDIEVLDHFVWDSNDLPNGGRVFLRAVPLDNAVGSSSTTLGKDVRGRFPAGQVGIGTVSLDECNSVIAEDLDGDGDLDLCATSSAGNQIAIYFQTERGVFGSIHPPISHPRMQTPRVVATGSLGGGGSVDLVAANIGSSNLMIFEGQNGTFSHHQTLEHPQMGGPKSVIVADLNKDGLQDLASANAFSSNLTVFFQSKKGEYDKPLVLGDSLLGPSIQVGDLNNDGQLDLGATSQQSNSVTLFYQEQSGAFANTLDIVDPELAGPRDLQFADFDQNGRLDLLISNFGKIVVFHQQEDGLFSSSVVVPTGVFSPLSTIAADFNSDGKYDLLSCFPNIDPPKTELRYQQSSGGFSAPIVSNYLFGQKPRSVLASDLNSDGLLDMAVGQQTRVGVHFQRADGERYDEVVLESVVRPVYADVNDDGLLDIVSEDFGLVLFQTFQREFEFSGLFVEHSNIGFTRSVAPMDLDSDGDIDFALFDNQDLGIVLQEDGEFVSDSVLPGGFALPPLSSVETIDFNSDQLLDLIVGRSVCFLQLTSGVFAEEPVFAPQACSDPSCINTKLADLDTNGLPDSIYLDGDQFSIHLHRLPHQYDLPIEIALPSPALTFDAADLDRDGHLDLVAVGGSSITVLYQQGLGALWEHPVQIDLSQLATGLRAVRVADLDSNGWPDLILLSTEGLWIMRQTYSRLFEHPPTLEGSTPTNLYEITVLDVDSDGTTDITVAGGPTHIFFGR
jgi:hypothetical protein